MIHNLTIVFWITNKAFISLSLASETCFRLGNQYQDVQEYLFQRYGLENSVLWSDRNSNWVLPGVIVLQLCSVLENSWKSS
jgi:hypothetical protein